MPDEEKKIEKPWCLYGGMCWWRGFGKIVEEHNQVVWIKCFEKDEPHSWDSSYVKRLASLKEAVEEYARYKGWSLAKVKERAMENFPSENID